MQTIFLVILLLINPVDYLGAVVRRSGCFSCLDAHDGDAETYALFSPDSRYYSRYYVEGYMNKLHTFMDYMG